MSFEIEYRASSTAQAQRGRRELRNTVGRLTDRFVPRPVIARRRFPQLGFDTVRPAWLSRPDFTPVDTSRPGLAGRADLLIDMTRPELWMDDDGEYPTGIADVSVGRHRAADSRPAPRTARPVNEFGPAGNHIGAGPVWYG